MSICLSSTLGLETLYQPLLYSKLKQTLSQRVQMAYVTVRFCQLLAFHINETKTAKFVNRPHEVKV